MELGLTTSSVFWHWTRTSSFDATLYLGNFLPSRPRRRIACLERSPVGVSYPLCLSRPAVGAVFAGFLSSTSARRNSNSPTLIGTTLTATTQISLPFAHITTISTTQGRQ